MAMVKLACSELDGTYEALTQRVSALEKAVKKGVTVNYEPVSEDNEEKSNVSETDSLPAKKEETLDISTTDVEKPMPTSKQDVSSSKTVQESEPQKAPVAKPATAPVSKAARTPANLDDIYKNAKPFPASMKPILQISSSSSIPVMPLSSPSILRLRLCSTGQTPLKPQNLPGISRK